MEKAIRMFEEEIIPFFANTLIIFGALWTIIEFTAFVDNKLVPENRRYVLFLSVWLLGIIYATIKAMPVNRIEFMVSNRKVVVKFGNLFDEKDCYKVVPVSRFFYETVVTKKSLQDQLIERLTKSIYLDTLTGALKDIAPEDENARNEADPNLNKRYALGTTIHLEASSIEHYLLFPLTKSEMLPLPEQNCNISLLWEALEKFWASASREAKGNSIAIPLIGSNVNGINLHPLKILEINLLAILYALESRKLQMNDTQSIEIIIYEGSEILKRAIDLKKTKQVWNSKYLD